MFPFPPIRFVADISSQRGQQSPFSASRGKITIIFENVDVRLNVGIDSVDTDTIMEALEHVVPEGRRINGIRRM